MRYPDMIPDGVPFAYDPHILAILQEGAARARRRKRTESKKLHLQLRARRRWRHVRPVILIRRWRNGRHLLRRRRRRRRYKDASSGGLILRRPGILQVAEGLPVILHVNRHIPLGKRRRDARTVLPEKSKPHQTRNDEKRHQRNQFLLLFRLCHQVFLKYVRKCRFTFSAPTTPGPFCVSTSRPSTMYTLLDLCNLFRNCTIPL